MEEEKVTLRAPISYSKRVNSEPCHPIRTEFMRDRDRILYSKAFRRLNSKTQIFTSNFDDHTRTRLTHTLEVAQISRTIAQILELDENLTEAIALGHDLGHTPFGHVGERTLNYIMNGCESFTNSILQEEDKGFKHNLQSIKVAIEAEQFQPSTGLNLTNFTLFGLAHHSSLEWKKFDEEGNEMQCELKNNKHCVLTLQERECDNQFVTKVKFYDKYLKFTQLTERSLSWSFEAFVVSTADEIAQRHHDLEDSLECKIMTGSEIVETIKYYFYDIIENNKGDDLINFKSMSDSVGKMNFSAVMSRFLVNFYVNQLVENSKNNLNEFISEQNIRNSQDFVDRYKDFDIDKVKGLITFPSSIEEADKKFQKDLQKRILNSFEVQRMDGKAKYIIRRLFKAYITNPQQLPNKTIFILYKLHKSEIVDEYNKDYGDRYKHITDSELEIIIVGELRKLLNKDRHEQKFKVALIRTICDYIAGMTDAYAIKEYHQLYG